MKTISRRRFVVTAALASTALRFRAQERAGVRATLTIPAEADGPQMPADFVGLSYEVQQLTDPKFFSRENAGLIGAFRKLAPHGVLRLGGNTSEFAYWKPAAGTPEPEHPYTRDVEGEPKALYYPVTPEAIQNLAGFLAATGWSCIYGIGMGTNTPDRAASEAGFVAKALGASLQYFQIGNEVDLFSRHLRDPKTWSPRTYVDEWLALARAIQGRVPGARFGMPDVAADISWLTEIGAVWDSIADKPHVTTMSHHYYFDGPATNPNVNIPNLLSPAAMVRVQKEADTANAAARNLGARVRMTEGNTCYRGGKPGVSDVFASALWSADYSLLLASNNYSGINLHGGAGVSVANSVGGSLPGDVMLREKGDSPAQIAAHPHPFYTPIAKFGPEYELQPVGYGLKFAGLLAGGTFIRGDYSSQLRASGINASAYAARFHDGSVSVIVLNKDEERDLELELRFDTAKNGRVATAALRAPSLDSREAAIKTSAQSGRLGGGRFQVEVPRSTGLRITVS